MKARVHVRGADHAVIWIDGCLGDILLPGVVCGKDRDAGDIGRLRVTSASDCGRRSASAVTTRMTGMVVVLL